MGSEKFVFEEKSRGQKSLKYISLRYCLIRVILTVATSWRVYFCLTDLSGVSQLLRDANGGATSAKRETAVAWIDDDL